MPLMCWRNSNPTRGWTALLAAVGGAVLIWCLLLPAWGRTPAWQRRISELGRQGVDGGAFFYTDHPRLGVNWAGRLPASSERFDARRRHDEPAGTKFAQE